MIRKILLAFLIITLLNSFLFNMYTVATEPVPAAAAAPLVESCDKKGNEKDQFYVGDTIYAMGSGFSKDLAGTLYVVSDQNWGDPQDIPEKPESSVSVQSDETFKLLSEWKTKPVKIWVGADLGKWDIVVDVKKDGKYNRNEDALDNNDIKRTAGFIVIAKPNDTCGGVISTVTMESNGINVPFSYMSATSAVAATIVMLAFFIKKRVKRSARA